MAEADLASLVICDAGPVIHLDELGCLSLLRDFVEIQIPDESRVVGHPVERVHRRVHRQQQHHHIEERVQAGVAAVAEQARA